MVKTLSENLTYNNSSLHTTESLLSSSVLLVLADLLTCRSCFLLTHPSSSWCVLLLNYRVLPINFYLPMNLHISLTSKTEVSIPSRSCKGMHISESARSLKSKVRNFVGLFGSLSSLFNIPSSSRYWEWEKTLAANANHRDHTHIKQLNEKVLTQITQ